VNTARTGAAALLEAAHAAGVRVCFANPGTTELGLVRALDDVPGIRPVLGLFEGVCTGAADGYARVSGSPALTLLHLGPGLANGLANLHNARRAYSPIINVIGDHATWHLPFDAPLTSDIESLAAPMSSQVIRIQSGASIETDIERAVVYSLERPRGVVTVIAPSDLMDQQAPSKDLRGHRGGDVGHAVPGLARSEALQRTNTGRLDEAVKRLGSGGQTILLLGSDALCERGQRAAAHIAAATGARLIMESYPAIVSLGGDLPPLERLAYFPDDVIRQLGTSQVILAGARAPVSYFGYEGQPSKLVSDEYVFELTAPGGSSVASLELVAKRVGAPDETRPSAPAAASTAAPSDTFSPIILAEELVQQIPEGTIISLEGSSLGAPYLQRAHRARRHQVMTNTGGAIGQGLPCAIGAAIAAPDARVICLQSDGSAQYTIQSLWTMAREALKITIILCANHRYGILQTELRRSGAALDRPATARLTTLDAPRMDWISLAKGYGVPGCRVTTREEFNKALTTGTATSGPYLIEAQLA
jgi:acetolactate synthase-1/2/3 large subunit